MISSAQLTVEGEHYYQDAKNAVAQHQKDGMQKTKQSVYLARNVDTNRLFIY